MVGFMLDLFHVLFAFFWLLYFFRPPWFLPENYNQKKIIIVSHVSKRKTQRGKL